MPFIEANVTVDLPDEIGPEQLVTQLQALLSAINGNETHVDIVEVDDPVSTNPIYFKQ